MMGGGFACEYEEIHTLSQCVSLAEHRHNVECVHARTRAPTLTRARKHAHAQAHARTHTHRHTLPFGSIVSGCHGNSRLSSFGLRLRMRAGAKRPLLINGNSQTSCGHLAPKQSSCVPTSPAPLNFYIFLYRAIAFPRPCRSTQPARGAICNPLAQFYSSATV